MKRKLNIASRSVAAVLFIITLIGLLKHLKVEPFASIGDWYIIMFIVEGIIGIISCIVLLWFHFKCEETDSKEDKERSE